MSHSSATYGLAYDVPASAACALAVLGEAGHEAWVVGGWVRDALRGAPSHDVDITTSAAWQETAAAFRAAGYVVHETGTAHGTVTVVIDGAPMEITTYRVDGAYTDHRHPDEVRFVRDVREDLARRDFTVNAMAYHPERGLLDPFGGRDDLRAGVIRAVGEARQRFAEDALRVLRAVRFAARLGFTVELETQRALIDAAPGLADIAQERIGQELDGIVNTGRVAWALLEEPEVMCEALPELAAMAGFDQHNPYHAYDVYEHTARVCRACEEFTAGCATRGLRWAALLHDIGKPFTFTIDKAGRGHFYGHPHVGAEMVEDILRRLALPAELVRKVRTLVRLHDHVMWPTARSIRRTLSKLDYACPGQAPALIYQLLDLKRSDAVSKVRSAAGYAIELDEIMRAARHELAQGVALRPADLAIGGRDVIAVTGMEPGPYVGQVLARLLEMVVNDEVENDRETLLASVELWWGATMGES